MVQTGIFTLNSSNFDTSVYDANFNSLPPPEGITWYFEPPGLDCALLTPVGGVDSFPPDVLFFSADRGTIFVGNIPSYIGFGALHRVLMVNGSYFVQTLFLESKCVMC